ncbi:TonB-dependent receptor [Novosphingobium chloroacetimidivorans]|uniref:TonB-dependent receptor n=1 Tax=Novosphingobium chloroacetimidivorans TaxID=1428314 RepID=A0A7W7NVW4_9SPHN|nr:TonB-dependent receptor [Novosphingobium chloroacetimidivorans]MBB4858711.1 TonB-dependent receptor [Novosphingobium chloroacetimidivorans]
MKSAYVRSAMALMMAGVCHAPMLASQAHAQDAMSPDAVPGADKDLPAEDIVVTGQREAQRAARAAKRDAFVVSDVISSDDIGKLPDHNTAAALRRIPGVSVQEDQGEPRFPVLRGLSSTYNRTTVDGAIVSGVDESGRTVPLDIVPSVMAGRVEVIKTVTPENDANAIGGIINIETRSAFDAKKDFFFNGIGSYGIYEQHGDVRNDKPSMRFAFASGGRFGADREWGVVIGASFEQLDYDIPQIEVASPSVREYTAAGAPVNSGDPRGNDIQVPTQLRLFYYNNTKQRAGANAKIEYRGDTFRWGASGIFARTEDDEERIEFRTEPLTSGAFGTVRNQTPTSGSFTGGRNIIQLNQPITKRRILIGRTEAEWKPKDQFTIDGDAIYSQGRLRVPNESIEFRTRDAQAGNYAFSYDTSGFYPVFTPANEAANRNPANFFLQQQRSQELRTLEKSNQFRLNVAWDDGAALKLKTGGVYRTTRRTFSNLQTDYTAGSGFAYSLDAVDVPGPEKLIRGRYRINPRIGVEEYQDFFAANQGRFTTTVRPDSGAYRVEEDVYAGYLQGSVKFGDLTLLGGLRYEHTKIDSTGIRAQGATLTPVENGGSYDNWLPGVHLRWDVNPQFLVRAAWTNTIGRPDYGSLAASESLTFDGSQARLTRGNPGLRPRKSEGFDLSFEAYPPDGLVSVAVFSKSISNEIFSITAVETLDVGRGAEQVFVTTPRNAETARIRGIELGVQQALTFLPDPLNGFGVSGNVTLIDSRFTFLTSAGPRVTGLYLQPDVTGNASIYYQRGKFEGRVSYNYIGGFLETINDTIPNADQYWKGRTTFDANISYRITPQLTIYAEGQNLSDAGRRELVGPNQDFLQESAEYGRTFFFGVTASF